MKRIYVKEICKGFIGGIIIGISAGILSILWTHNRIMGVLVFVSLTINMVLAGLLVAFVPIFLKKMKLAPANTVLKRSQNFLIKKFDKVRDGFRLLEIGYPMKTTLVRKEDAQNKAWRIVDATGIVLGKLAVRVADVLRGKDKPTFTPHVDNGDFVIVINADKVKVTGKKEEDKKYMFYSMYVGNERRMSLGKMRKHHPEFIIEHAVKGMLQKNRLANAMIRKLKVYSGAEYPHTAQKPKPLVIC
jgi:large subunit ribosomal protein L13